MHSRCLYGVAHMDMTSKQFYQFERKQSSRDAAHSLRKGREVKHNRVPCFREARGSRRHPKVEERKVI